MIVPLAMLLILFPTMIYQFMIGNYYLGGFLIIPIGFAVYTIIYNESTTKAMDFLRTFTEEKKETPEDLMIDLMDNMYNDDEAQEKYEELKNRNKDLRGDN